MTHKKVISQEAFQQIGRAMRIGKGKFGPIADQLPSVVPMLSPEDILKLHVAMNRMVNL